MVSIMVGESAAKQLLNVPLSNNTITRRLYDMSEDMNDQLIEKLKYKHFSIQLDEATDNNDDADLIYYVRFIDGEDNIIEDLLFCKSITAGSKAVDLFEVIDSFMDENSIDWTQCVSVCTDGARSMSGRYGGLQAPIRNQAPDTLWTHYVIHREALTSQFPSPLLNEVVETVIKIVNFSKTRPMKARFFQQFCIDTGAEHTALLCCCNSRWLSRGNVMSRVY
jgi:hypothetical protein